MSIDAISSILVYFYFTRLYQTFNSLSIKSGCGGARRYTVLNSLAYQPCRLCDNLLKFLPISVNSELFSKSRIFTSGITCNYAFKSFTDHVFLVVIVQYIAVIKHNNIFFNSALFIF